MKPIASLAAILLIAGCAKGGEKADEDPTGVAEVKTAVVADAVLPEMVTAYGSTEFAPGAERTLASPGEAIVKQVLVAPGAPVSAGQPVVELGPSVQSQTDLTRAVQDAATADQALARARRLRAAGLASDADVESARSASVDAAATVMGLRARTAGVVRSPVAGVVDTLTAAPGDLVAVGASLGKVGSTQAIRIRLGVEPSVAARLGPGMHVTLSPASGGDRRPEDRRDGVIAFVDPRADPQTRLAGVIVQPPAGSRFTPGQPIRGDIVLHQGSGPVAPRTAVYYDQDQPYLMLAQAGVAHRRDVKLAAKSEDQVQIRDGVRSGDRIIVEGGASLEDGAKIREAGSETAKPEAEKGHGG